MSKLVSGRSWPSEGHGGVSSLNTCVRVSREASGQLEIEKQRRWERTHDKASYNGVYCFRLLGKGNVRRMERYHMIKLHLRIDDLVLFVAPKTCVVVALGVFCMLQTLKGALLCTRGD